MPAIRATKWRTNWLVNLVAVELERGAHSLSVPLTSSLPPAVERWKKQKETVRYTLIMPLTQGVPITIPLKNWSKKCLENCRSELEKRPGGRITGSTAGQPGLNRDDIIMHITNYTKI